MVGGVNGIYFLFFLKACLTPAKSQRRSVTHKQHHASPYQSTGEVKGSPSNEQARQPKPKPNSTTAAQAKDPKATASKRETTQEASANKNEQERTRTNKSTREQRPKKEKNTKEAEAPPSPSDRRSQGTRQRHSNQATGMKAGTPKTE